MINVSEIYPTIQGEGGMVGTPVVLVRLQGCSVGCPFCDTKYSWPATPGQGVSVTTPSSIPRPARKLVWTEKELAGAASELGPRWVLLTGGEPAEQDIDPLCRAFRAVGLKVMIETSGTALFDRTFIDMVTLSPKVGMPGGKSVLQPVVDDADECKWVVGKDEDLARLEEFLAFTRWRFNGVRRPIWLQPMSLSENATKVCIEACLAHKGQRDYRLSIQTHKLLGLP